MHHNLHSLAHQAANPDFAALCNLLSFYEPGTEIDVEHCAKVIGIEPTLCAWFLDTIMETGAVLWQPDPSGFALAA